MTPLEHLRRAFWAAVEAAQPNDLAPYLPPLPQGRLVVVGAGKAAARMAQTVEMHYATLLEGLVITRYGHALPTQHIEVVEAAHPVPDSSGRAATQRILKLCRSLKEDDLLLCLLSGGGSALLSAPAGISLEQQAELTKRLLKSGASIQEMNILRKHLSHVKGGLLAVAAQPARVLTLVISDVVGDDLSSIASGPTVPDSSTYEEALSVLQRYEIDMPEVRERLGRGLRGEIPETPKANHPAFERSETHIIASNQQSLLAAKAYFESQGITAHILSDSVTGEAREVAKVHASIVKQILRHNQPFTHPCVLLSGGETTVTMRSLENNRVGRGGRNAEFALSLACELTGLSSVYALAADTDGIDGSEDNAGAFVTPNVFNDISLSEARGHLHANDSYSFFERSGHLFVTGPTHTNVNDLRLIWIG